VRAGKPTQLLQGLQEDNRQLYVIGEPLERDTLLCRELFYKEKRLIAQE
jgi:hypothetical protein